jgi:enoyl-CoA hydratase/carnithine racemase
VVAADDLVCFFPELALGHFVTGGLTHILPRCVGTQRAMELIVLGERHDAHALHRMGIVNRVVPLTELMPRALDVARQVASRSALATQRLKRVVVGQFEAQLTAALELEREAAMACFASADTAQRIAAFASKRL